MAQILSEHGPNIVPICQHCVQFVLPCQDPIWAILEPYKKILMPEIAQIFTEVSCMPTKRILIYVNYLDHIWSIIDTCFGHFYHIFAPWCLNWMFLLKKNAFQTGPHKYSDDK